MLNVFTLFLKRLSKWLVEELKCEDKIIIEWLPLALFDSHSRFALLFRQLCLDIQIDGQTSDFGVFKTVGFGSEVELEYFLKLEFCRELADKVT